MYLPEKISKQLGKEHYQTDETGMSGSSILLFPDKVLKIQENNEEARNEYRMMKWLDGKLPVPRVLAHETEGNKTWLLMSRCEGEMACDARYMSDPVRQTRLLAQGLRNLWHVDISDCPADQSLTDKLNAARYQVEHGLVDLDNVEPDTFGENGFADPEALLQWLFTHRPPEEPVLSHGDYTLPNVFLREDHVSGYIDLGRSGIADKWCDIALCCRSLSHNYGGRYHGRTYDGFDEALLFRELGLEPDWEKIRYYILLDELF